MPTEKRQLFVEETQFTEYGYLMTRLEICDGEWATFDHLIERCVDNKTGYFDNKPDGPTGLETAMRMKARYEYLRTAGYPGCLTSAYSITSRVTLTWQHHGDRFCDAEIKLPDRLERLQPSAKLLNDLVNAGKRGGVFPYKFVQDPMHVMAVLRRRKVIVLETVKVPQSVHATTWDEERCVLPAVGVYHGAKVAS
jgi:hypothetical protein